jgi:hypothetical protein
MKWPLPSQTYSFKVCVGGIGEEKMPNKIWSRDQQSDITFKGSLAYACWRSRGAKVYIPVDIAPASTFLTDSIVADLKAIAAERIGP